MSRQKSLLKIFNELNFFYHDLNQLIVEYDPPLKINGIYVSEWQCPKRKNHSLWNVVHDSEYLYINCTQQGEIYRYSFDGNFINSLTYNVRAMEIVNNQLYLLGSSKFFIVDIKTNSTIESWDLPKVEERSVSGHYLKVDQERIYFTPLSYSHVFLYSKKGKEIAKFGSKEQGDGPGQFWNPHGLTVDERYLYVCDRSNTRVQVLDKENGTFQQKWERGQRYFSYLQSIFLHDNRFYVGDLNGVQVFTKEGVCIDVFGDYGSTCGNFALVKGLCIVNDNLYIVDYQNKRIQVLS